MLGILAERRGIDAPVASAQLHIHLLRTQTQLIVAVVPLNADANRFNLLLGEIGRFFDNRLCRRFGGRLCRRFCGRLGGRLGGRLCRRFCRRLGSRLGSRFCRRLCRRLGSRLGGRLCRRLCRRLGSRLGGRLFRRFFRLSVHFLHDRFRFGDFLCPRQVRRHHRRQHAHYQCPAQDPFHVTHPFFSLCSADVG